MNKGKNNLQKYQKTLWTSATFCDIVCATEKKEVVHMTRKKQVNIEKRAVMAREEPSCDRSFVMVDRKSVV